MIRIAVAAVLALAISSLARPAHAVVIDTAVTSNGEPVGGATVRVETLDGDPIRLTAVPEDHGKSAGGPAGDNTKAEVVTGKDGKLLARLDDGFRNSTVLVVVEKSGQVLMKKSVELSKDVNQVAIGVPPERLAMLPKPNAGPPGGDEGRQDAPPPPPAASRATLVPERTAGPPELAVAIGREGECRPGGDCCYRVTVTNTGPGPWHGPIGLGDEIFVCARGNRYRTQPAVLVVQPGRPDHHLRQRAAHARQRSIERAAAMRAAAAPDVVGGA